MEEGRGIRVRGVVVTVVIITPVAIGGSVDEGIISVDDGSSLPPGVGRQPVSDEEGVFPKEQAEGVCRAGTNGATARSGGGR